MQKISWSDKFSVGFESIDNQHAKIIQLINTLIEHQNDSMDSKIMVDTIAELLKYSSQHLEYEEKLLKSLEYPEYTQHKEFHVEYVEVIAGYSIEAITTKNMSPTVFMEFLKHWWTEHILKEDMKFKPFLLAIQKHNMR